MKECSPRYFILHHLLGNQLISISWWGCNSSHVIFFLNKICSCCDGSNSDCDLSQNSVQSLYPINLDKMFSVESLVCVFSLRYPHIRFKVVELTFVRSLRNMAFERYSKSLGVLNVLPNVSSIVFLSIDIWTFFYLTSFSSFFDKGNEYYFKDVSPNKPFWDLGVLQNLESYTFIFSCYV